MTRSFYFNFFEIPCCVEIHSPDKAAFALPTAYQTMFPWFTDADRQPARFTVRIRDIATDAVAPSPDDPIFAALRENLTQGYAGLDAQLLAKICSPAFISSAEARNMIERTLADPQSGLSIQKDFLVCTDHGAGTAEILADVSASLGEAWGFHILNFFKIFFFRAGAIRLHGSSATHGERALVLLANTGGGKSTMKNLFLQADDHPAEPFTDDSIIVMPHGDEFRLYQDPVEFMRWCYLPREQLADHVIPRPRPPIGIAPTLYYMEQADHTHWRDAGVAELFERINAEAFYQKGFLTQRFIPQPDSEHYLSQYMDNTRRFLADCRRRLAGVRHHDDYTALFSQWRADLGLPRDGAT